MVRGMRTYHKKWLSLILGYVIIALISAGLNASAAMLQGTEEEETKEKDPSSASSSSSSSSSALAPGPAPGMTSETKLVHVMTLTRHGSRAPDKILATVSCQPLLEKAHPAEPLTKVFVSKFGTIPGELTRFGEDQMEEVGRFIKERYGKDGLNFINTDNYFEKTTDWEFIARAGSRQQRSMMAVAQGIFPGTAVPIAVTERSSDSVLGGPAAQCGAYTAKMIVDWHETKGKELVLEHYEDAVAPFEKICNVSLKDNPVNAAPGGPNPHAWIGDVSDLLDSMRENIPEKDQPKYSKASYEALTDLAFNLEQRSHFDDPRGAIMFAGEFPNKLLTTAEDIVKGQGKRPKGVGKMRMFACSRELEYGLSHMFGWEQGIRLPNQPTGRVLAGSTIIWELWRINGKYYIDTLMFQPGVRGMLELQPRTLISEYREQYHNATRETGTWKQVCNVKEPTTLEQLEAHGSLFWFVLFLLIIAAVAFGYRRGFRRAEYQLIQ